MNNEVRKRILDDAKKLINGNQSPPTPLEALSLKMMGTRDAVLRQIRPVLQAGGGFDKDAIGQLIFKAYIEHLHKYGKDELIFMLTMTCVESVLKQVDADPWGKGTPDPLSGQ